MLIKYSKKRYWPITLIILSLVFISGCVQQGSFKPNPPEASLAYTPTGNGWVKIYEGTHVLTAQLTSDGGFIVFGTTMNDVIKDVYGWVTPSVYLFKTDSNGSVTWNITFNYAKSEPIGAVSQTADGGFVLVDSVYKSKSGKSDDKMTDADILLTRITSDGSIVYNRTIDVYGKNTNDAAWLVTEASDGGFAIGGVIEGTGAYTLANGNTFLIKTDMKGNVLWTRTFELEENDFNRPLLLQQTQDKGFMIFGEIQSRANNERYAYFIKTDSNGNKQWEKIFKRDKIGIILRPLIEQTPDGGYLVVGIVSTQINVNTSDERPSIHAYVMELDTNGNTLAKKILSAELYAGDSIEKTSDGGYIVANEGVYLIKLDAEGNKMWERQMTDKDSEILEPKAYQTADNGYIIIGNLAYGWNQIGGGYGSGDLGVGSTAVVIIKVDENGHLNQTIYPRLAQRLSSPAKRVTGKGWNKTFGGDLNSGANAVQQTSDGGYIATGWIGYGAIYPSGLNDTVIIEHLFVYLVKTDANGNEVWNKSFGGPGMSMSACSNIDNIICTLNQNSSSGWLHGGFVGHSVWQTSDGGYIITGRYASGRMHNRTSPTDYAQVDYGTGAEVYLIKTDANGNMQWNKTFDGEEYNEVGYSVQQTSDKGFFIVGITSSYGVCPYCAEKLGQPAPEDIYLIKTDADGNVVWKKIFGGMNMDMAFSGQQTSDGGFIVGGVSASLSGNGVEDAYLLKIDKDGNKMWEKTFGKKDRTEKGSSVQQTSDGGYIIVGQTVWGGAQWETESDVYLIKTDANGNEVWEKEFGGDLTDIGYSVEQTSDGGYIISGFTGSFEDLGATYLIKTDANGNKVWEKTFEGISGLSIKNSVQQTTDGGYIIAAGNMHTHNIPEGLTIGTGDDAYLIKTDENGDV